MTHRKTTGFTLVEVLVALGLMAVGMLAIAPLFVNSLSSNAAGDDFSRLNALAKGKLEEVLQYGFDDPRIAVPDGATFSIVNQDGSTTSHTGQLYRNEVALNQTVGGVTTTIPYELVYTVEDYPIDQLTSSALPNYLTAVVDSNTTWSGANGGKLITVYAAAKRMLGHGGHDSSGNVIATTSYTSAGVLSTVASGKQIRLMAYKSP